MAERGSTNPDELPKFEPKTLAERRFIEFYSFVCTTIQAKAQQFHLPLPSTFPPPIIVCSDEFFAARSKQALETDTGKNAAEVRIRRGSPHEEVKYGATHSFNAGISLFPISTIKYFESTDPDTLALGQAAVFDETIHAATRFVNTDTQQVRVGFSTSVGHANEHDLKAGQIYMYSGNDQGEFNEYLGFSQDTVSVMVETSPDPVERGQADLTEIVTHLATILLVSEVNPAYTFDALEFSLPQARKMPRTMDIVLSPAQRQFALGRALRSLSYGNARDLSMQVTTQRGTLANLKDLIEGYGYISLVEYQ